MRFTHKIEGPDATEVKERVLDSRWIPAAIMTVTAIVCVFSARKQSTIIINNFKNDE
jgi:hypothetical protein